MGVSWQRCRWKISQARGEVIFFLWKIKATICCCVAMATGQLISPQVSPDRCHGNAAKANQSLRARRHVTLFTVAVTPFFFLRFKTPANQKRAPTTSGANLNIFSLLFFFFNRKTTESLKKVTGSDRDVLEEATHTHTHTPHARNYFIHYACAWSCVGLISIRAALPS